MHENVFATLTADKAIALGVIEPLHCSLFHLLIVPFGDFYACMGVGRTGQALAVTREAAQMLKYRFRSNARQPYQIKALSASEMFFGHPVLHAIRPRQDFFNLGKPRPR